MVIVPGYRSRCPGSIPGANRFSEKYWVWKEVHSASCTVEELLERKEAASV
jgi:hypothetical protein